MSDRPFCWICAGEFAEPWPRSGAFIDIDCTTCGKYRVTGSLLASQFPLLESERYRMSFWCKRRQLEGRDPPVLGSHTISGIVAQLPNPPTHQKPDLLLVSLTLRNPTPGEYIRIDDWRERSLACARDQSELNFFLRCLLDRQEVALCPPGIPGFSITGRGWERAAQLADQSEISKTAFVAMKFNDEMLALWPTAFERAIKRAGFEPRLANDPQHNEQIDAHIIVELKQCRFVIADVTFAAAGVYFEAGYALGMGRPVIWTCRTDRHRTDMHFDTRQYNHILWESAADLSEQLYYRIVATI
jgi:nucleoside 2-deoxyribosyltransferase